MKTIIGIDIIEQRIADYSIPLLNILLMDRTTGKNILWASDDYAHLGVFYSAHSEIKTELIIGEHTHLIQPRTAKTQSSQVSRTRDRAEVFTPSWVCNAQNNLIDEAWFGHRNVFNIATDTAWKTQGGKITFPDAKKKTWQCYVDANRLEVSCGEAPYLVSRYDASTGEMIELQDRIGLLDRKLRVVNENTTSEDEWFKWTQRAFQSIYGYEFQGDSLLLARENLLFTFIDNIHTKFNREPTLSELKKIATIISWNLWQMDGMTYTIPYGTTEDGMLQMSMFDTEPAQPQYTQLCRIKDWRAKTILEFKSMLEVKKQ